MHWLLRRSTIWALLNIAGMAWYLKLASALWVTPGDLGNPGGPGDAFYWAGYLVPVLVGFLAFNGLALFYIARRVGPPRRSALRIWRVIGILWLATVIFDHHKASRNITVGCEGAQQIQRDA